MESGFLDICGRLAANATPTSGSAVLSPSRYTGALDVAPSRRLVEGVHQFAVRLARGAVPVSPSGRLLPAGLKSFDLLQPPTVRDVAVRGEAEVFGTTARVRVTGRWADEDGAGEVLLRAEIVVVATPPMEGARGDAEAPSGAHAGDLFVPASPRGTDELFAFRVNGACPLLREHFPDRPIAPGSLVVGYVEDQLRAQRDGWPAFTRLRDVQFIRPVTPGVLYRCRVSTARAGGGASFFVAREDGHAVTRGTFAEDAP